MSLGAKMLHYQISMSITLVLKTQLEMMEHTILV